MTTTLSLDQWSHLLTRAARDGSFQKQLFESPEETARSIGIELDQEGLAHLKEMMCRLSELGTNKTLDEAAPEEFTMRPLHVPHLPPPQPRKKKKTAAKGAKRKAPSRRRNKSS